MHVLLRVLLATSLLLVGRALCSPPLPTAWAHALLERSDPPAEVVLPASPRHIRLTFSEDLNPAASRIVVWDRDHRNETVGAPHAMPGAPRVLQIGLRRLSAGSYLVLWTSVSSEDGHADRGYFAFSVIHSGPGPSRAGVGGAAFGDTATLATVVAHWIELVAATLAAGTALCSAFIFPMAGRDDNAVRLEHRLARRLIIGSLLALTVASCAVLLLQAYSSGDDQWSAVGSWATWVTLFADQYSQLWLGRQVLVALAVLCTLSVKARTAGAANTGYGIEAPAVIGAVYLYALAASGHAASAHIGVLPGHHASLFSASIALDWLHLLADALWLGGQGYIVLVLIPVVRRSRLMDRFVPMLDRFSPIAYLSIGLYLVTGAFSGVVHIPGWIAFAGSIYGRALMVKMVLIALMLLVSAYTVFALRPRLRGLIVYPSDGIDMAAMPAELHCLFRWLVVNPVLGCGVLLATAVMFYYPVPISYGARLPTAYVASGGGLTADFVLDTPHSGVNTVTLRVRAKHVKRSLQASVTLLAEMPGMQMGQDQLPMHQRRSGLFQTPIDLPMSGRWRLVALVYRPGPRLTRLSVDVQLADPSSN